MSDQDELRDRLKRIVDETDDGGPAAQVVMKSLPRSPHYGASGSRDHPRQILTTTRPFTVSGFSKGTERDPAKGTVQEVESKPMVRAQHVKRSGKPQAGRKL